MKLTVVAVLFLALVALDTMVTLKIAQAENTTCTPCTF